MSYLRRLLAALLAGALWAALGAAPAEAAATSPVPQEECECEGTVANHVSRANAVFTGRVARSTRVSGEPRNGPTRRTVVRVQRVYKGEIASETVEVVTGRRFAECAGELRKDRRFVFFVEANEGYVADPCGGTAPAEHRLVRDVEQLLGKGRAPVPSDTVEPTLTPAGASDPPQLSRVAAPGLALVLIGVLGLAVLRRLSR